MHPDITLARNLAALAQVELARVTAKIQMECKHTNCAEADYIPSDYGNSTPPLGICLDCGITEKGWSVYYVLNGLGHPYSQIPRIERSRLRRICGGLYIDDGKQTQLARREESLCTLVAAWLKEQEDYYVKAVSEHACSGSAR